MNKLKKVVSFVLLGIMTLGICGCDEAELKRISESNRDAKHVSISQYELNRKIEDCTGTLFLRIGMANSVAKIDKINDDYSGMTDDDKNVIPEFIIVTPGEHTVTDNTRYDITTLPKDESGYYKGIEITVYEIDPETSERVETTSEEVPVLPINEIVGTYQDSETIQAIMKGEDEDEEGRVIKEEEFLFTYVITAVDDNKILIEFGGVKLGEGIYDPVSCSCDFVVAPEFYESMHATSTGDKTMRLVFSKVDGIIQFEQTVVGSEGEPTIAYKV